MDQYVIISPEYDVVILVYQIGGNLHVEHS